MHIKSCFGESHKKMIPPILFTIQSIGRTSQRFSFCLPAKLYKVFVTCLTSSSLFECYWLPAWPGNSQIDQGIDTVVDMLHLRIGWF